MLKIQVFIKHGEAPLPRSHTSFSLLSVTHTCTECGKGIPVPNSDGTDTARASGSTEPRASSGDYRLRGQTLSPRRPEEARGGLGMYTSPGPSNRIWRRLRVHPCSCPSSALPGARGWLHLQTHVCSATATSAHLGRQPTAQAPCARSAYIPVHVQLTLPCVLSSYPCVLTPVHAQLTPLCTLSSHPCALSAHSPVHSAHTPLCVHKVSEGFVLLSVPISPLHSSLRGMGQLG